MKEISNAVIKEAMPKTDVGSLVDSADGICRGACVVQVFDRKAVANKTHLLGAYLNAILAFKNHTNRSKSLGMEMLLFASLTDQINDAIKTAGAKAGSKVVVFASSDVAFSKIRPMLKDVADFNPSAAHQDQVLKRLRVSSEGNTCYRILQAMAVSRLGT